MSHFLVATPTLSYTHLLVSDLRFGLHSAYTTWAEHRNRIVVGSCMRNKPVRMQAYVYVQCIHVLEIGVVVDNVAVYIVSLLNHHRSNIDALVSLRPTRFAISDVYAERVAQTRSASGRLAYARG